MEENHFEKICTIKSNNNVNVSLYRSKLSGMRVAFVEQPTLIVNGRFTLATKATSDDDLPHTLEHLTFEGSQKYPYKGFLNIVANQCFGSDINGSTAQDHTFYSISTVGQEGFLKILPIYLDHLFFPLLSPEQYITKIHHINAEGRDGGVVYAEMQDLENSISTKMNSALHRIVFPKGHPYRANTGGSLPAIRDLCSLERIKAFHKEYYRPSNMMITIVGNIDVQKVTDILSTFEKQYNDFSCKIYPFHDVTVPEYFPFQLEHIKYPAEDESVGRVSITWQGPPFATPDTFALPYLLLHFISDPET
uniref:Uncharacterized protein n=1 Tax=Panagrolaimus sp. ES5 TaxID=591445 RepID=A0AC34G476_9BILA